jgi:hypothetical protein
MKTLWGEEFIHFHHNLVNNTVSAAKNKMFDFSKWFERNTKSSKYYYIKYLALFLFHGILFENFLTNEEEIEFTEKKVLPSFNKIEQMFGLKPLIVPLTPISDENNLYWWCYPEHTKKFMRFMVILNG